jgi:hypothetical protein
MADQEIKYEARTIRALRGMEARATGKQQKLGWELVSQKQISMFRTEITFRREKKHLPKYLLALAIGVPVLAFLALVALSAIEGGGSNFSTHSPIAVATSVPTQTPTPSPSATVQASAAPIASAVTSAEVIAAFQSFFADRASEGSMWGKAANEVTFENGVVRVTFDPAAAGVDQATFDGLATNFAFPIFVATPIAFNDDVGNRIRPAVASIETARVDGTSLGTIDAGGILALNGLSK